MPQIRVIRFVAVFLAITISSAGQSLINLPNCSSVCGLKVVNYTKFELAIEWPSKFIFNNTDVCVENEILPITAWNRSAREFMRYIGMNDEKFGCPTENSLTTIPYKRWWDITRGFIRNFGNRQGNTEHIGRMLPKNLALLGNETLVDEPNNIPGSCSVKSYMAVERQLLDNSITTDWLASIPLYNKKTMETEGVIFSALNASSNSPLNIRVPKNANDNCVMNNSILNNCTSFKLLWLPASTFNTSVFVSQPTNKNETFFSSAPSYSMFARFKFGELPGAKEVLEKLKEGVKDFENVNNDLSPSNLAILCLPLLMAIPPLSLLGPASNATIAWYAFATDILAAIPLMIKGIEIILLYRKATPKMRSALGLVGEKFGIFETWDIRCQPPRGRVGEDGVAIVAVAFWFMVASTYVEFLFWREVQYRKGRLKKFEDNAQRLPDSEPVNSTAGETDCRLKRILRSCFRGRRKYSAVLSVILTDEFLVMYTAAITLDKVGWVSVLSAITLVVFRAVLVKRFRQFIQWNFWVGVVIGFVTGPVYLLLHAFEDVRKSDEWEAIAEGCNAGFGFLSTTLKMLFPRKIEFLHYHLEQFFWFPWIYSVAVILTHTIRSEASDRKAWRFGCHGFALGTLFGPFGLLFKRCFPECVEHKRVRQNFFEGLLYGTIFCISLICIAVGTSYRLLLD